jgi:hypothetical protein
VINIMLSITPTIFMKAQNARIENTFSWLVCHEQFESWISLRRQSFSLDERRSSIKQDSFAGFRYCTSGDSSFFSKLLYANLFPSSSESVLSLTWLSTDSQIANRPISATICYRDYKLQKPINDSTRIG